jgi:hypothetical protein
MQRTNATCNFVTGSSSAETAELPKSAHPPLTENPASLTPVTPDNQNNRYNRTGELQKKPDSLLPGLQFQPPIFQ